MTTDQASRVIMDGSMGAVYLLWPVDFLTLSLETVVSRYINSVSGDEMKLINDLAFHIVKQQQRHLVISPWSLMAAILMQNREGISVRQLVKEADWLKRQAYNLGAYVDWPGEMIDHES